MFYLLSKDINFVLKVHLKNVVHVWFKRYLCPQTLDLMVCFQVSERKHISETMVKNRNPGGRRSSTCKTKKADSHVANSKDLAPLGDPAGRNTPAVSPEFQTTGQGQLGFSDRVYLLASVIFQNNHLQKPPSHILVNYGKEKRLPLPEVKDEVIRRTAYELAFNTLKCECVSD